MEVLCRVCLDRVLQKHATALFTDDRRTSRSNWPSRLEELLHVSVSASDCLPGHICRGCRGKVESLEKKLVSLREKARASYEKFSYTSEATRKRTKAIRLYYKGYTITPLSTPTSP